MINSFKNPYNFRLSFFIDFFLKDNIEFFVNKFIINNYYNVKNRFILKNNIARNWKNNRFNLFITTLLNNKNSNYMIWQINIKILLNKNRKFYFILSKKLRLIFQYIKRKIQNIFISYIKSNSKIRLKNNEYVFIIFNEIFMD